MSDTNKFTDYLSSIISDKNSEIDSLKRCSGKVLSIVDDGGKAVVECMGRSLTLLNKTGEILYVGDSVWVHYWTNLANGYIALRNGLPNVRSGELKINSAVAMLENQSDIFTVSTEVFDVDIENNIKVKYGDPKNIIVANEIPIIISNYDNTNTIAEIYDFISSLSSSLISTERSIDNDNRIYTVIIGNCTDTWQSGGAVKWNWGADVLWSRTYEAIDETVTPSVSVVGTFITNICLDSDNYTLHCADGTKAYFDTFDELGIALLSSQICSATTEHPFGYVICRAVCIAKNDNVSGTTAISKISSRTFNVAFKNEAEYNYAVTTLTKSELNP